jgi:class 3 adenylate cyclase
MGKTGSEQQAVKAALLPVADMSIARQCLILLYNHSISPSMGVHLSSEHVERRLAAILAVDVVGYSRLMGADELGTFEEFGRRKELLNRRSQGTTGASSN